MGAADVVPGVSGGTMAFVLGIYGRLIAAIRAFDLGLVRLLSRGRIREAAAHVDLALLLPLGVGIASALLFFTRVVPLPRLLHTHPEPVYGLFFGLILASIAVLVRTLPERSPGDTGWALLGLALGLAVVNLVPVDTPEHPAFVFLAGALAICAMILPGISGSFILLVLRKYAYVFGAVASLDLAVLLPFGLGAACGLLAFSRLLHWLLEHHYRRAVLTIAGVLTGSLWMIWPFQARTYETVAGKARLISSHPVLPAGLDGALLAAGASAVLGFAAVIVISRLAARRP